MNKVNTEQEKPWYYHFVTVIFILLILLILYMIVYGGQYSYKNKWKAKERYEQALVRNENHKEINNKIAEENNRLINDERTQRKEGEKFGYKRHGEKIIQTSKTD